MTDNVGYGRFDAYQSAIKDLQQMDLMGFDYPHKDTIREALYLAVGAISNDTKTGSLSVPDGWKLVPIEPTKEITDAGITAWKNSPFAIVTQYKAMIAAAPQPPKES